MDMTSVTLGRQTRDDLRDYRDEHDFPNYNAALRALLAEASDTSADAPLEVASR
jgi:Arc/MetJ-type ribon-helix-helix transcriptional regulator